MGKYMNPNDLSGYRVKSKHTDHLGTIVEGDLMYNTYYVVKWDISVVDEDFVSCNELELIYELKENNCE